MKLKILILRDRFLILVKKRLSGVAEPFDKLRTGKDIQCYMGNPGLWKCEHSILKEPVHGDF